MIGILSSWSFRRVKASLTIWGQLALLSMRDWTTVVYFIIPSLALLSFEGYRYYHGVWFQGMTPNGPLLGPLTFHMLFEVAVFFFLTIVHFSTYGHLPFALEPGDRVYALGAPVSLSTWSTTLWCEGTLWIAGWMVCMALLTLPIAWFLQLSPWLWFIGWLNLAVYFNSSRIIGTLWRRLETFRFSRFLIYQGLRLLFFIPVAVGGPALAAGHNLVAFASLLPAALVLTGVSLWFPQRVAWDPFFHANASVLLMPLLGGTPLPQRQQTLFLTRIPSQAAVSVIEVLRPRQRRLHPVSWLTLLRLLRKRGMIRDYSMLSLGAIAIMRLIPNPFVRYIGLAFILFLFYQYWKGTIRPLYQTPAKEQTIADRWALEVAGSRFTFTAMIISVGLWVALSSLLHHLLLLL